MTRLQGLIPGLALLLACAGPAAAENVLRFSGKDAWAATMDPHAYSNEDNKGATYQVYEALLDIDSNLAIVPQLALAWNILDPTHWQFELRQGVRFHDGTPFTADDVVFSIGRAQAENLRLSRLGSTASRPSRRSTTITIRITTTAPDPSLWLKLADVAIMSKAWAQAHGVTESRRFRQARTKRPTPRATPTAPARSCSNPSSRAAAGSWSAILTGGVRRPTRTTSTASFMSRKATLRTSPPCSMDEIDLLQTVPYWALPEIRRDPGLKLAYRPKLLRCSSGSIRAAPSCARPTSRAATRSRTNGCARRWPTRWT